MLSNLSNLINEFVEHKLVFDNIADSTARDYNINLKQFSKFAGEQINNDIMKKYIITIKNKYALSTVNKKIKSLLAFSRYLEEELGYENLVGNLSLIKDKSNKQIKYWTKRQIRELFNVIHEEHSYNMHRDIAIIKLYVTSGLRKNELVQLDKSDIDLINKTLLVNRFKTHDEQLIELSDSAIEAIDLYLMNRNDSSQALFVSNRGSRVSGSTVLKMFKKYASKVVDDNKLLEIHSLRRTFITLALQSGADIKTVMELANHVNMKTTSVYTGTNTNVKRKAVNSII